MPTLSEMIGSRQPGSWLLAMPAARHPAVVIFGLLPAALAARGLVVAVDRLQARMPECRRGISDDQVCCEAV